MTESNTLLYTKPLTNPIFSQLEVFSNIDSTQIRLKQNPIPGHMVLSFAQSAGYGTQSRIWESPYGNFNCSFVIQSKTIEGLSLVLADAVVRAVQEQGIFATVKFPNDVLVQNKKLAGILVELQNKKTHWIAICGIGINLSHAPLSTAISLLELGKQFDPEQMFAIILPHLTDVLIQYQKRNGVHQ